MAFFPLFFASLLRKCIRFAFSIHKKCLKRNGERADDGEQMNLLNFFDFLTGTEKERRMSKSKEESKCLTAASLLHHHIDELWRKKTGVDIDALTCLLSQKQVVANFF